MLHTVLFVGLNYLLTNLQRVRTVGASTLLMAVPIFTTQTSEHVLDAFNTRSNSSGGTCRQTTWVFEVETTGIEPSTIQIVGSHPLMDPLVRQT